MCTAVSDSLQISSAIKYLRRWISHRIIFSFLNNKVVNVKKYFFFPCIIVWIFFPIISLSQTIQNGAWSTPSGDVEFYISQDSQLDTLRVKITFTSGNCSGSITKSSYGISIVDRSFSEDLGSTWDGSTGSITGDFSEDGTSCGGSYSYTTSNCGTVSATWTATVIDSDTSEVDLVEILDINFLNALIERGVDSDGDGAISFSEAEAVDSLDVSSREISDMTGIEAFINLESLNCISNQLSSLNVSENLTLELLWCRDNQLTSLDVSNNSALDDLWCSYNQLTSLDVSSNLALEQLWCRDNQLASLDVSNNTDLIILHCRNNLLTNLDVSNNATLIYLNCGGNQLTNLDVSNNTMISELRCYENQLTSLDISSNPALEEFSCRDNKLVNLDVSNNTALILLECSSNQLTSLDVSNNTALIELSCSYNPLTALDVSANSALTLLWCVENELTSLDVSNNADLETLLCFSNQLTSLDVSNNPFLVELWCGDNLITSLDISVNTALGSVDSDSYALDISSMPTLYKVCVWTMPFPPADVTVNTSYSPNVTYTTECSEDNSVEELNQSGLSIYPNPVMDILTIETIIPGELSISITSLNGQIIESRNSAGSTHQIDLSSFQRGVYFIIVRSKNNVTTEKIIKL